MTDVLERARAALEGTTPGPWEVDCDGDVVCSQGRVAETWEHRVQDARFMALSRQLVPEMIDEIERMRGLLVAIRDHSDCSMSRLAARAALEGKG